MSEINKILGFFGLIFLLTYPFQAHSQEGDERVGQAGAFELLINPWAPSCIRIAKPNCLPPINITARKKVIIFGNKEYIEIQSKITNHA